jgi:hypothetical protein
MRFIKIGDSYFNPMRIEQIESSIEVDYGKYKPIVVVHLTERAVNYDAMDLGFCLLEFNERWEALGFADAMVAKVVSLIEEALT